jgi:hypothetical protein
MLAAVAWGDGAVCCTVRSAYDGQPQAPAYPAD